MNIRESLLMFLREEEEDEKARDCVRELKRALSSKSTNDAPEFAQSGKSHAHAI